MTRISLGLLQSVEEDGSYLGNPTQSRTLTWGFTKQQPARRKLANRKVHSFLAQASAGIDSMKSSNELVS